MIVDDISIDVEPGDDVTLTTRNDKSLQITITQAYGRLVLWLPPAKAGELLDALFDQRAANSL